MKLEAGNPSGPLETRWDRHREEMKLVNPANKRKFRVLVVGSGLAGGSAAASLAELGYDVDCFCIQDSPRRAHSIAAQGGINAAKNYPNDGDSIWRLFYDTIKGGDYRSRESNVYRLAQVSNEIIDQCVAQGVPFAREYGGLLANRSFGGAQVSRTFYARGQTGQQLLLGAYSALSRQIHTGGVAMHPRTEMLDLVVKDDRAVGIVTRNVVTGEIESWAGDAVVLATGGYGNVFYLSTNAKASNVSACFRAWKRGAAMANPCFVQIHPTCIPVSGDYQSKLTLMSESLRNDGRVWVPKAKGDKRAAGDIPEDERDYYLERRYPSFGNLVPRDVASRAAKLVCDEGRGVGKTRLGVYLDFTDAIERLGEDAVRERYGNLFHMYEEITDEDPYKVPMRIYPAIHYTMGGLWVDYNLMSTIPGLHVIGEANFSDHGANRLGASALMQGLADGYFVLPYTMGHWLATAGPANVSTDDAAFRGVREEVDARIERLVSANGTRSADSLHRELGKLMWDACGMSRTKEGLEAALAKIPAMREEFWKTLHVPGTGREFNLNLEQAGRVADYFEFAEVMFLDALDRKESSGGHFRDEYQTPEGEALRDDESFQHVSVWEHEGDGKPPTQHREPLSFEFVTPSHEELQVMKLTLKIWRQKSATEKGAFETYPLDDVLEEMSFLEMLDVLNEKLLHEGKDPVMFDNDCREGICGMCSLVVNGKPHGPERGATVCQLYMRKFHDGQTITIEPWRAAAFPVLRDLAVDRWAMDRIIQAGGYVSVKTGGTPDANTIPIPKDDAESAMDAASCIGCGACVAACKNASAMLFVSAKVGQLAHLPQGQPERKSRALAMVAAMDVEGFGACSNTYDCEAACPKAISVSFIQGLHRDVRKGLFAGS